MSVDIDWDAITGGEAGASLALKIRDFIDDRFQTMALPRFIKSVKVHDFAFGSIPPEVSIKDITDPLPDFYEENPEADEQDADDEVDQDDAEENLTEAERKRRERALRDDESLRLAGSRSGSRTPARPGVGAANSHLHPDAARLTTPGIPGGTSNMHYFHAHWSGAQTPLAAVAGRRPEFKFPVLRPPAARSKGHSRNDSHSSVVSGKSDFPPPLSPGGLDSALNTPPPTVISTPPLQPPSVAELRGEGLLGHKLNHKASVSTFAPGPGSTASGPCNNTSSNNNTRPQPQDRLGGSTLAATDSAIASSSGGSEVEGEAAESEERNPREPRVEDIQAVFRINYAGNLHLALTADLLLDYPMPAFVGIPVKLNITGLSFDGVGVVAKIRRRVHFCFLSPEDALGYASESDEEAENREGHTASEIGSRKGRIGGLLKEVKVESEIGQREDGGRQSLKNVGKVERFVLEQIRKIFEEELVFPSYWTFLI